MLTRCNKNFITLLYYITFHEKRRCKKTAEIKSRYINFYNNYRIQTKTKPSPLEKRNQFVA